jgi:hypothetical protein
MVILTEDFFITTDWLQGQLTGPDIQNLRELTLQKCHWGSNDHHKWLSINWLAIGHIKQQLDADESSKRGGGGEG